MICDPVVDLGAPEFKQKADRLVCALEQFRAEFGFGRAIAAPQIGILQRMIAVNLGEGPFLLVNPELAAHSPEKFTLWDDCMSFPWLMVRVQRHLHVDLRYLDESGHARSWTAVDQAVSELLQHEVDHLDGILAIDRVLDRESIIARRVYESNKTYFNSQADYAIVPTLNRS